MVLLSRLLHWRMERPSLWKSMAVLFLWLDSPILCEVMTAGVRRAKEKNGRVQSCKYRKLRLKIDLEKGERGGGREKTEEK